MAGKASGKRKGKEAQPHAQAQDWLALWAGQHKSLLEQWIAHAPAAADDEPGVARAKDGSRQVDELIRRAIEDWARLARQGSAARGTGDSRAESLRALFDPVEWYRASLADPGAIERLADCPALARPSDLDRKLADARNLALQLARHVDAYRALVQAAWQRAYERFLQALGDDTAPPLAGARDLIDLWLAIANEALLEMHRSAAFLAAQRGMTRAASDYRLQERAIAEAFCAMHHIPTRTEMDEAQRTIWELKREVRALRAQEAPAAAGRAPAAKRGPTDRQRANRGKRR